MHAWAEGQKRAAMQCLNEADAWSRGEQPKWRALHNRGFVCESDHGLGNFAVPEGGLVHERIFNDYALNPRQFQGSSTGQGTKRQRSMSAGKEVAKGGRFQGRFSQGSSRDVDPTVLHFEESIQTLLVQRNWDRTTTGVDDHGQQPTRTVCDAYELFSLPPCPKQLPHSDSSLEGSHRHVTPWGDVPLAALLSQKPGTRLWVCATHV